MQKINVFRGNLTIGSVILSLFLIVIFGACTSDDYTDGSWSERTELRGSVRSFAASFVIGNSKGYIATGQQTSSEQLRDLWEYDIAGDYWQQRASMPDEAGKRARAVGFSVGNKGYVATGYQKDGEKYLKDTWEYNPSTDTWTRMDDLDNVAGEEKGWARQDAIAFSIGEYGYLGTGYGYLDGSSEPSRGARSDMYRFDPTAASGAQWSVEIVSGMKSRSGSTVFIIDNAAYICTGENNGSMLDDFYKFDPSKSTPDQRWTALRRTSDYESNESYDDDYGPIARSYAVSFVIDGLGYVVTGSYNSSLKSDYCIYNPATDLWKTSNSHDLTPFNYKSRAALRQGAVSFSTGQRGFVLTGQSSSSTGTSGKYNDMWELLPNVQEEE